MRSTQLAFLGLFFAGVCLAQEPEPRIAELLLTVDPKDAGAKRLSPEERAVLSKKRCAYVDLREDGLPPAVRDQDGIGWCFAYATADLLSYHHREAWSGAGASAMNAGIRYFQEARKGSQPKLRLSDEKNGYPERLVGFLKENGVCSERDAPSRLRLVRGCESKTSKVVIDNLFCLEELVNGACGITAEDAAAKVKGNATVISAHFPSVPLDSVSALLKLIVDDPSLSVPQRVHAWSAGLESLGCKNKLKVDPELKVAATGRDPRLILRKMNQALDDKTGSILTFNSGIFSERRRASTGMEHLHANMIVGRRWNPASDRCEYLFRNTWGSECSKTYRSELVQDLVSGNSGKYCQSGYLWIPESDVNVYGKDLTYIKK